MIKKFKKLSILLLGFLPLMFVAAPSIVSADTVQSQAQCGVNDAAGGSGNCGAPQQTRDVGQTIAKIINIISAIGGVAAVIMLIVAGLRFVTSAGSESAVKGAKSTIVYVVIGLIIIAVAQVIVHFVIYNISTDAAASPKKKKKAALSSQVIYPINT